MQPTQASSTAEPTAPDTAVPAADLPPTPTRAATATATPPPSPTPNPWAFEETFDGDPDAPSQALLPQTFDYAVTHRTHPGEHFRAFDSYPADHADDCTGPNPAIEPLPQHLVVTSHESNGRNPDPSFFICKNHMMSSMGEVDGYSVAAFWPRQEFDFSDGGILEFDININDNHTRIWFEILIAPRSELKVGSAHEWLPIDETYPKERIVFEFADNKRTVQVGSGGIDPEGIMVETADWQNWRELFSEDPANDDRRIRRTMRITLADEQIIWSIEQDDGAFNDFAVAIPGGLPFTQGLVVFKTHAYTPEKDGNMNAYTFHWDNIRFSGPVVGRYESFEADEVAYLQANGDREIGEQETIVIDLPHIGPNPILFGQVHNPMEGQVLLSVNGRANISVQPYDYAPGACSSGGWKSFQFPVDSAWLVEGTNTFTWTIGPRPDCAEAYQWDGFSIKSLEIQFDLAND
ncbi:MAG: hypothetical protein GY803_11960 [Chloroflexi bacterium]|nr:hypothetical protein [Chloroflexota bacterium]